jgi:acyl carrier protein
MSTILHELNDLFREVFEDEDLVISRDTSAKDVAGWDSLMHVTLILSVEKQFGIRFFSSEVSMLKNAGELADLIAARANRP